MNQAQVIFTLRKFLKAQKISYKNIADKIGTTESAIKNAFHSESLSLDRLLAILEAVSIDARKFFALVEEEENVRFSFSEEQEEFFSENLGYFSFFQEIFFNRKTLEDIRKCHGISELSVHRYVRKIEDLGIWSSLGNGKFRFHISGPLNWRPRGPWMRKFYVNLTTQQASAVLREDEAHPDFVSFGVMSLSSSVRQQFEIDMNRVIETYREKSLNAYLLDTPNRELFGWNLMIISKEVNLGNVSIDDI